MPCVSPKLIAPKRFRQSTKTYRPELRKREGVSGLFLGRLIDLTTEQTIPSSFARAARLLRSLLEWAGDDVTQQEPPTHEAGGSRGGLATSETRL